MPYHLANGPKKAWRKNLAEDTGLEPVGRRNRPRFSKPLHYHSGNLPDMSGYEFRRRSIFAVGFHAALTTSTAFLFLDTEAGFEPAISGS